LKKSTEKKYKRVGNDASWVGLKASKGITNEGRKISKMAGILTSLLLREGNHQDHERKSQ
jgi:hypothetical protein